MSKWPMEIGFHIAGIQTTLGLKGPPLNQFQYWHQQHNGVSLWEIGLQQGKEF